MGSIKRISKYMMATILIVFLVVILGDKFVVKADQNVTSDNQQNNENINNVEGISNNSDTNNNENISDGTNNNDINSNCTIDETNQDMQQVEESNNQLNNNHIQSSVEELDEDLCETQVVEKTPIVLKESSITLNVGETKTLFYKNVSYSSSNKDILDVTKSGLVTAKKTGIASVILSNDTTIVTISVFVLNYNDVHKEIHEEVLISNEEVPLATTYGDMVMDLLAKKIADSVEEYIIVNSDEIDCVTSKALEQLYKLKKNLSIVYEEFTVDIYGEKIDGYGDGLKTDFTMTKSKKYKNSYVFKVGNKLPGKVRLKLNDRKYNKKYIYVYNKNSNKYKMLSDNYKKNVELKNNEEYLFTDIDLDKYKVDVRIIVGIVVVIGILLIIYVVIKKRYWFW